MLPSFLLPDTLARKDGQGEDVALEESPLTPLLITLEINRILEQESLNVSVLGSSDGRTWNRLGAFPAKSYCGQYSLVLDLAQHRDVRALRVDWSMSRWTTRWNPGERELACGFRVLAEEAAAHAVAGAA